MHWNRLKRLLIPVLLIVVLDRWTKAWATETLAMSIPRPYWNDFFRLQYALNEGAFLSLGANMPDQLRFVPRGLPPLHEAHGKINTTARRPERLPIPNTATDRAYSRQGLGKHLR